MTNETIETRQMRECFGNLPGAVFENLVSIEIADDDAM